MKNKVSYRKTALLRQPEELFYRSCYAPVDLESILLDSDQRSKIRKLPVVHVYFPMKELDDDDISKLLPHITEEQWTGILDFELWTRDELDSDQFLALQRHLLECEDAVARKLLRATEAGIWQLLVRRNLQVFPRLEEDEFDESFYESGSTFPTPDGYYLLVLPSDSEKSRLLRLLIIRLYQLAPEWIQGILYSSQFITSLELLEDLYENRKRRIEEMGFLDYFDAIKIYTPISPVEPLPCKENSAGKSLSELPVHVPPLDTDAPLFLFRTLALLAKTESLEPYIEDIFFLSNKVLSADQISPDDPESIKKGMRKVLAGVSLGLESWSESNPARAIEGLQKHFVQAFFQIGFGLILQFREQILAEKENLAPSPGSYLEAALEGFIAKYPFLVEQGEDGIDERYFETLADLEWAKRLRRQMEAK